MKKYLFALVATVLSSQVAMAKPSSMPIGGHEGNGGDICENRFKVVRDDVSAWIETRRANSFKLPKGRSLVEYKSKMSTAISNARILCVDEKVEVRGVPKTCMNFYNKKNEAQIVCDKRRFMQTEESDQYVLVHHEYAGLAGFEVTSKDGSDYSISNRLKSYLHDVVLKRLAMDAVDKGQNPRYDQLQITKRISLVMAATDWTHNCKAGANKDSLIEIQEDPANPSSGKTFSLHPDYFEFDKWDQFGSKLKVTARLHKVIYELEGGSQENPGKVTTRTTATINMSGPMSISSIEIKRWKYVVVQTGTGANRLLVYDWQLDPETSFTCQAL